MKKELMQAAKKAREAAYAPYSHFNVGAAILTESGKVFSGCNVENASYGLTVCAERNAIGAMVAGSREKPISIAVAGKDGVLCPPCGACRQVLSEFNPELEVILESENELKSFNLKDLLPLSFSSGDIA